MAAETPSQRRLANALISLKGLLDNGLTVLRTDELSRHDREALVKAGFLKPVIKGWYTPSRPGETDGEATRQAHARTSCPLPNSSPPACATRPTSSGRAAPCQGFRRPAQTEVMTTWDPSTRVLG
jgi:hypothetical protein